MKYLLIFSLLFLSFNGSAQQGIWAKLYGDDSRNTPQAVKAYAEGVYLAATVVRTGILNDETFATFSKFDITTGQLLWEVELDFPSVINDFVYVPEDETFILVGRSDPFDAFVDGFSFMLKVTDSGAVLPGRGIDQNGREQLTKIVRHEQPQDSVNRYFAVGGYTPEGAANAGRDITVLFNFDAELNINWRKEYLAVDGQEIEGGRGLFPSPDGTLFLLGNDIKWNNTDPDFANNNGTMIHVDADGEVLNSQYYPGEVDWWEGHAITQKVGLFAGHRFGTDEGYLALVDLTTGEISYGLRFPELKAIRNLVVLGNERRGGILFSATFKHDVRQENHLFYLEYSTNLNEPLQVRHIRRHEETAEAVTAPLLHLHSPTNLVAFADGRRKTGDPTFESLIQTMSPNIQSSCLLDVEGVWDTLTVPNLPFELVVEDDDYVDQLFDVMPQDPNLNCRLTCGPPDTCMLALDAIVEPVDGCFDVNLVAIPTGGQAPYTITWEIDCGMGETFTTDGLSTPYTFPPAQSYTICVTIIDADSCTTTIMLEGDLDNEAPVITGCVDTLVILPTDPGTCTATFDANNYIAATDNCSEMLTIGSFIRMDRSSREMSNPLVLDLGTTGVLIDVTDEAGNLAQCTIDVLVVDQQAPTCPTQAPVLATADPCGAPVTVDFANPTFNDNCPGPITVSTTSMPSSGDVFPVGTTAVTFEGGDGAGNVGTCTVNVIVTPGTGSVVSSSLDCRGDDDYRLTVDYNSALPTGLTSCSFAVNVDETFVDLQGPVLISGSDLIVDLFGSELFLEATATTTLTAICPCADGTNVMQELTFEAPVECCLELTLPDTLICSDLAEFEMPILGLDQLGTQVITQVRYYVADPPLCSVGGNAFQVTNGYVPLALAPSYHPGNICVYAEVDLAGDGACKTIGTEIVTIERCDPVTGSIPDQSFCFDQDPVVPAPLVLTLNGGDPSLCGADVQWFGPDGAEIPGATGLSFQPDPLALSTGSLDCDQRFTYEARITSICGTTSATATIRLFNENAPVGDLTLEAPDVLPLCPGEDAIIRYTPVCTGDDMTWTWWERTAGSPYVELGANGNQNPVYLTNRRYEDTWYLVTKQNGSCTTDSIEFFLDVADALVVTGFSVAPAPACQSETVELTATFTAPAGCADSIFYYHNGVLAGASAANASLVYTPAAGDVSGNYHAVVRESCCGSSGRTNTVTLNPAPTVAIAGPCFICNSGSATLTAVIDGFSLNQVTLQWFADGMAIGAPNATSLEIFDETGDVYTLEMTVPGGCTYTASFTPYERCFLVAVNDLPSLTSKVYPNPATNRVIIETERAVSFRELAVYDALGRPIRVVATGPTSQSTTIDLVGLPAGVYVLQGITDAGELLVREVVKE